MCLDFSHEMRGCLEHQAELLRAMSQEELLRALEEEERLRALEEEELLLAFEEEEHLRAFEEEVRLRALEEEVRLRALEEEEHLRALEEEERLRALEEEEHLRASEEEELLRAFVNLEHLRAFEEEDHSDAVGSSEDELSITQRLLACVFREITDASEDDSVPSPASPANTEADDANYRADNPNDASTNTPTYSNRELFAAQNIENMYATICYFLPVDLQLLCGEESPHPLPADAIGAIPEAYDLYMECLTPEEQAALLEDFAVVMGSCVGPALMTETDEEAWATFRASVRAARIRFARELS